MCNCIFCIVMGYLEIELFCQLLGSQDHSLATLIFLLKLRGTFIYL